MRRAQGRDAVRCSAIAASGSSVRAIRISFSTSLWPPALPDFRPR